MKSLILRTRLGRTRRDGHFRPAEESVVAHSAYAEKGATGLWGRWL